MQHAVLNWSSGKDAALAYHLLRQQGDVQVTHLLTTLNAEQGKVFMHGVSEQLIDLQAARMGLPLTKVRLPAAPSSEQYERIMTDVLAELRRQGVSFSVFGDIFLEDLRQRREVKLQQAGFGGLFPLWQRSSVELVHLAEQAGIEAVIVCVDERFLGRRFLGRRVDSALLADLPAGVDPCGENGEFHSFVYNAPFFRSPIAVQQGSISSQTFLGPDGAAKYSWLSLQAEG